MYAFDYRRPGSLNEADLALKAMPGAKLLAGGQTLIPALKLRLNRPEALVDLGAIASMRGIGMKGGDLVIGAMTTHAAVAESADVRKAIPGLAQLAEGIGDPQVRHRGTIGGSIANNDPAADYPAGLLALGATVHTNKRAIAADDFFTGLFGTALEDNEIITEVAFPVPAKFIYLKHANPASRFALVGVAVAVTGSGTRVAVTGAGSDGVFRVADMETALSGGLSAKALDGITVAQSDLMTDIHAAADYRAHLISVLAKRAVAALA
jgi:carbon-monoxide dehydrogenase medium subunit